VTAQVDFSGQIAVITGASRGIGAALAIELGAAGAHCVLIARTVGGLEATDDAIRQAGGHPATLVPLDLVNEPDKIDALGAELYARYGRIDLLVGNAAMLGSLAPVAHIPPAQWQEIFALNVTANYRLLRSFEPLLRQSQNAQAVFVTCSLEALPFWGAYAASKAALEKLVQCYAAEMASSGIQAYCLDPGATATALHRTAFPGIADTSLQTPQTAARHLIAQICSL
jgi:NAD(P)-dependent dehydrogenase (short-subunit alcohol dehydrogenase family)